MQTISRAVVPTTLMGKVIQGLQSDSELQGADSARWRQHAPVFYRDFAAVVNSIKKRIRLFLRENVKLRTRQIIASFLSNNKIAFTSNRVSRASFFWRKCEKTNAKNKREVV